MIQRKTPIKRSTVPLKRSPIRRVSKKRSKQLKEYSKRRRAYLDQNPICMVWLRENGWRKKGRMTYQKDALVGLVESNATGLIGVGAPLSTEVHHVGKRRGALLNEEGLWLAVCRDNHERIEGNKMWARENGYLLNF